MLALFLAKHFVKIDFLAYHFPKNKIRFRTSSEFIKELQEIDEVDYACARIASCHLVWWG